MTSEHEKWQKLKNNYLRQVEQALASVDHPRTTEILRDVDEHLETKYAELYPEQQNWESYQRILIEMGPPDDYAELLMETKVPAAKSTSAINTFLAVVFVIVLIIVGGYLIYEAEKTPAPVTPAAPTIKLLEFEADEQVLGKWITIDFVKHIDDFDPSKKSLQGNLYLKGLDFQDKGVNWWFIEDKKYKHHWTKGKIDPISERPAFYYLRNVGGQPYLFCEWISGDVTMRGREPALYVLKPVKDGETVIPIWFEEDPQAIGYWVSVDFVKNIDDFQPDVQQTTDLFLKTLRFEDNGRLWWTIGESSPIELDWTKDKIRPSDVWPAVYLIKQFDDVDYLFYEYRTRQDNPAGYYVFKRTPRLEIVQETKTEIFQNDPQVLGYWKAVDFVEIPATFDSNQKTWRGNLYLKSLDFKQTGTVEWCLGEDNMKINHRWTKGKLLDDELDAHYIIQTYENDDYLFMEWNSGDVTIRGQKPAYYVLKRLLPSYEKRRQETTIVVGANFCTADYIQSILGTPVRIDHDGRMLRYTNRGLDFWFSRNGSLSEIHINKGCTAQLETEISMASHKEDVFAVYGKPVDIIEADDLHRKNDEGILYQKGKTSRIYYGQYGLIFWFGGDAINQIVVFKGSLTLE